MGTSAELFSALRNEIHTHSSDGRGYGNVTPTKRMQVEHQPDRKRDDNPDCPLVPPHELHELLPRRLVVILMHRANGRHLQQQSS
jgi:hypothetical protein